MADSRWKPLSSELPDATRALAEGLRELLDRAGLSLRRLATEATVHHSLSGLQRFFAGQAVPPPDLLVALVGLGGDTPEELERLTRLRERALTEAPVPVPREEAGPGSAEDERAAPPVSHPATEPVPETTATRPRPAAVRRPARTALLVAAAGLAAAAGSLALSGLDQRPGPDPRLAAGGQPAAPGCSGQGCLRLDPKAAHCDLDATTLAVAHQGQLVVELRYSARCDSGWAKILGAAVGDRATVHNSAGEKAEAAVSYGADVYSPMVPGPGPVAVWACGSTHTTTVCTGHR